MTFLEFKGYRQYHGALKEMGKLLKGNEPEIDPSPRLISDEIKDNLRKASQWLVILVVMFLMLRGCDHAFAYTQEDAIKAVIGEAENQGEYGMLAVSCAIRNRGSLQGVYGLHAPRVLHHKYSKKIYLQAKMAWKEANKSPDIEGADNCGMIDNAQYWGSLTEDKKWIVKMQNLGYVHTATIGMQTFYRKDM